MPLDGLARRAQLQRRNDDQRYAQAGTPDGGMRPPTPGNVTDDPMRFTVTLPSGDQRALVARYVGKMALVSFEDTDQPGHYVFEALGHRVVRAVNVDTRESPQAAFEPLRLAEALQLAADELSSTAAIGQHIREARHGKELYKLIVVLVILLMILELGLSRVSSGTPAPTA